MRAHGAIAYRVKATSDDPATFSEALSDQLGSADLVVTSGGVSKGTHDVVKEVLSELGTVEFLEVAMQPGKPQGFGVVGEDGTPIFTLPGNPVSAYVSFEMFVVPALHKLTGRATVGWRLVTGTVTTAVRSMRGKQQLVRAEVALGAGVVQVTPVGGAGSHLIAGLAKADALIVLAEGVTHVEQGDEVPVLLLDLGRRRRATATASPTSTTPVRRAWSTCPARTSTARTATASGKALLLGRGRRRCCAVTACPRATRSEWLGWRGSWPPSAPPNWSRCAIRWRSLG